MRMTSWLTKVRSRFNDFGRIPRRRRVHRTAGFWEELEPRCLLSAQIVTDLVPPSDNDPTAHNTREAVSFQNELFFTTNDGAHGWQIWKSDGTTAGTAQVTNLPSSLTYSPQAFSSLPNTGPLVGSPLTDLTVMSDRLYFIVQELHWDPGTNRVTQTQYQLWSTDGTTAGTRQVTQFSADVNFTGLGDMTPVGSTLFFVRHEAGEGDQLWKTNGTTEGTTAVTSLPTSFNDPGLIVQNLAVAGSSLVFTAQFGPIPSEAPTQLWSSDGTSAGTHSISDGLPADDTKGNFFARGLTNGPDAAYFLRNNLTELWRTDGTAAGTTKVFDASIAGTSGLPGDTPPSIGRLRVVSGSLDFVFGQFVTETVGDPPFPISVWHPGIWKVDGTPQGAHLIADFGHIGSDSTWRVIDFGRANGKWIFVAGSPSSSGQLFGSDGTVSGTQQLATTGDPSDFQYLIHTNPAGTAGQAYFFIPSNLSPELWRTDGTIPGTIRLTATHPEVPLFGDTLVGDKFFFLDTNTNTRTGVQWWVTDGTNNGTHELPVVNVPSRGSNPSHLVNRNGRLLFFTQDFPSATSAGTLYPFPAMLWSSDGTEAGTIPLASFTESRIFDEQPQNSFLSSDGILYFSAGGQLWRSDGTPSGTSQVTHINQPPDTFPLPTGLDPNDFVELNHTLYFFGTDGVHGYQLWRSDGTETGTVPVTNVDPTTNSGSDFFPGFDIGHSGGSDPGGEGDLVAVSNGKILFNAQVSTQQGYQLWVSDGTAAGTRPLTNDTTSLPSQRRHQPGGFFVHTMFPVAGRLYFSAGFGGIPSGWDLWSTDGTPDGTVDLAFFDPNNPTSHPGSPPPTEIVDYHGEALFFADASASFPHLWLSDGTSAGTIDVTNALDPSFDRATGLLEANGFVYFLKPGAALAPDSHSLGLWRTNGTAAGTVSVIPNMGISGGSVSKAVVNGTMYWNIGASDGYELWKSDGTAAGTTRVSVSVPGFDGPGVAPLRSLSRLITVNGDRAPPSGLSVVNDDLFFVADDGYRGLELWHETVPAPPFQLERVYRLYNPHADLHVYTISNEEFSALVNNVGLNDESSGHTGYALLKNSVAGSSPVHRLYNAHNGQHYYTTNDFERDYLLALDRTGNGWVYEGDEGAVYGSSLNGSTELYMLYNDLSGEHLFTPYASERDAIVAIPGNHWHQQTSLGFGFTVDTNGSIHGPAGMSGSNSQPAHRAAATREQAPAVSGEKLEPVPLARVDMAPIVNVASMLPQRGAGLMRESSMILPDLSVTGPKPQPQSRPQANRVGTPLEVDLVFSAIGKELVIHWSTE